jgi:7,8-dihydropterin-6-yl-methyl-4-(beta-D-ribofuranosyl)aminobenzene 5'-phosphate synthase
MDVTILSENTKLNQSKLNTEHGLSILIETDDNKVLFDTGGPKGTIIQNAKLLNLDLSQVDAVVISHGHNDHSGGLLDFFKLNDIAPVYLKKEALNPHYTGSGPHKEFIGLDQRIVQDYNERLRFVTEKTDILEGFTLIPDIHKKFITPTTNQILFSKEGNQVLKDKFNHELFMTVKSNNELTIFSGCGHSGIVNMFITAEEAYPEEKIKTIIGGFHFQAGKISSVTANSEEIKDISRWIKSKNVEKIYTGHCTGEYGFEIMKSILKSNIEQFYTGKKITIL